MVIFGGKVHYFFATFLEIIFHAVCRYSLQILSPQLSLFRRSSFQYKNYNIFYCVHK